MIFSLAKLELNVLNIIKMICEKHFHVILVFDSFVYAKTMCHMFFPERRVEGRFLGAVSLSSMT